MGGMCRHKGLGLGGIPHGITTRPARAQQSTQRDDAFRYLLCIVPGFWIVQSPRENAQFEHLGCVFSRQIAHSLLGAREDANCIVTAKLAK